jgi:hypothetical protein
MHRPRQALAVPIQQPARIHPIAKLANPQGRIEAQGRAVAREAGLSKEEGGAGGGNAYAPDIISALRSSRADLRMARHSMSQKGINQGAINALLAELDGVLDSQQDNISGVALRKLRDDLQNIEQRLNEREQTGSSAAVFAGDADVPPQWRIITNRYSQRLSDMAVQ